MTGISNNLNNGFYSQNLPPSSSKGETSAKNAVQKTATSCDSKAEKPITKAETNSLQEKKDRFLGSTRKPSQSEKTVAIVKNESTQSGPKPIVKAKSLKPEKSKTDPASKEPLEIKITPEMFKQLGQAEETPRPTRLNLNQKPEGGQNQSARVIRDGESVAVPLNMNNNSGHVVVGPSTVGVQKEGDSLVLDKSGSHVKATGTTSFHITDKDSISLSADSHSNGIAEYKRIFTNGSNASVVVGKNSGDAHLDASLRVENKNTFFQVNNRGVIGLGYTKVF